MKYLLQSVFYMMVLVSAQISVAAQERKVSVKLWQDVRSTGTVRILVMFNLSQESLRNISGEDQIVAAQDMLVAELSGTKSRVNGRLRYVPGMGLSVDSEGLSIVERSSIVDKVNEETPYRVSEAPARICRQPSSQSDSGSA